MTLPEPESAFLVIADISGYTAYLSEVELNHAQDILADLLGEVVKSLRPRFDLSEIEGDAAFVYTFARSMDGSLLQDAIDVSYFSFRQRRQVIEASTSCPCRACASISQLDLKIIIHHGPAARQRVAGQEKLIGRDVIVVHRLLKNTVVSKLGIKAHAMYTQDCVDAVGIDPSARGLIEHHEPLDIVADAIGWVYDLNRAYRAYLEGGGMLVPIEGAAFTIIAAFTAPRATVWEWFVSPRTRPKWIIGLNEVREIEPGGKRRGRGTVAHCLHGNGMVSEQEVVGWKPFDLYTIHTEVRGFRLAATTITHLFSTRHDGSTQVDIRVSCSRVVRPLVRFVVQRQLRRSLAVLRSQL